jgi:hypothetical protein
MRSSTVLALRNGFGVGHRSSSAAVLSGGSRKGKLIADARFEKLKHWTQRLCPRAGEDGGQEKAGKLKVGFFLRSCVLDLGEQGVR